MVEIRRVIDQHDRFVEMPLDQVTEKQQRARQSPAALHRTATMNNRQVTAFDCSWSWPGVPLADDDPRGCFKIIPFGGDHTRPARSRQILDNLAPRLKHDGRYERPHRISTRPSSQIPDQRNQVAARRRMTCRYRARKSTGIPRLRASRSSPGRRPQPRDRPSCDGWPHH